MELDNIMLSQVTQYQKDMHGMLLVDIIHNIQSTHGTLQRPKEVKQKGWPKQGFVNNA